MGLTGRFDHVIVDYMKFNIEYPWIYYSNRDKDLFDDITMFDLTFSTTIHYFKNHETGYEQLLLKILGFGIRITRKEKE